MASSGLSFLSRVAATVTVYAWMTAIAMMATGTPTSAPAADGRATEAALAAVAAAFGVRRNAVTLVTGRTSRTKVVDVAGGDPRRLADLLG